MENNYVVSYNNYDEKGNRLAVFGTKFPDVFRIFILKCSKSDQFSKKLAKKAYWAYMFSSSGKTIVDGKEYHPGIVDIIIPIGDSTSYALNQYCKGNFYRLVEREVILPIGKTLSMKNVSFMGSNTLIFKSIVKK